MFSIVAAGFRRFGADLAAAPPLVISKLHALLDRAPGNTDPVGAALAPSSFPVMALPVWVSRSLGVSTDREFQADVAGSSVHGYHFIRLIDNVMDGDAPAELARLLPLTAVFHAGFERPYRKYFGADHPFWDDYQALWHRAAFATTLDAFLEAIDEPAFRGVSGLKFSAAAIPVAAVVRRAGRAEVLDQWRAVVDRLGRWYQMVNDLLDWHHDAAHGIRSYFLSQADQRRDQNESLAGWVSREGFGWAVETLEGWMDELQGCARALEAPDLERFLDERRARFQAQIAEAAEGLRGLDLLLAAFS